MNARVIFQPTILLALALMAVIVMMILPMPAWVLDIGLAASFGLAILIFTVTLFIERPLDFSAFPTVLLATLMLRLSLNVSSTKLIIGRGHEGTDAAGNVIEGFAMFVMGGSVFLGLVVFGVLLIVNFIVITKGAGRMAEVGARFALDGMPGKQLAIDSDMAAGAITHEEARARRATDQAETTFFGSLDGASKFVKGDAVAGLLITLLNLFMGLLIGVAFHGMPLGAAFETYAILTVGDGLVSQIPAVIISIAAALLLARGGATGSTDTALFSQLGRYPAAMATVAVLMALFALVPGLPFLPFVLGAAALGFAAYHVARLRRHSRTEAALIESASPEPAHTAPKIGDLLDLDDIHLVFAPDLVPMILHPENGLESRIQKMREHIASAFGLILPEVRLTDDASLPLNTYEIRIQGAPVALDRLLAGKSLLLLPEQADGLPSGEDVAEPVYAAPARWIPSGESTALMTRGLTVVSPSEVLATHLLETVKRNFARLMTRRALRRLLDELTTLTEPKRAEANRRLFDELIPDKVAPELLLSVLKLLVEERVSIRNLPVIVEAIDECRTAFGSPEEIAEYVRQRLGFQIVAGHRRADGTLALVQLAPEWEGAFEADATATGPSLSAEAFRRLGAAISEKLTALGAAGDGRTAVVTLSRYRRLLRAAMVARGIANPVLSYEEIGQDARPSIVGVVSA